MHKANQLPGGMCCEPDRSCTVLFFHFFPIYFKLVSVCGNFCVVLENKVSMKTTEKGNKRKRPAGKSSLLAYFPGAAYVDLVVENYSFLGPLPDFPLAGSDSFTTLNTWGQVSFS